MQSWFEIIDVAPVIRNEAFLEQDDEDLVASKSGLLQNNAVEPYPRTMNNALYDSDSNEEGGEEDTDVDQYSPPPPTHHNNCLLYTSPSPRDATLSRMPSSA